MTLRIKSLLIINCLAALLLTAIAIVARIILLDSFTELELAQARRNLTRLAAAVGQQGSSLLVVAKDWAHWDDAHRFLRDRDPAFVTSNFQAPTFQDLGVDLLALADKEGRLVEAAYFSRPLGVHRLPAPLAKDLLTPALLRHPNADSVKSGLVVAAGELWQVAALPVLTSKRAGPPAGGILMARRLDRTRVEAIAKSLGFAIQVRPAGEAPPPGAKALPQGWVKLLGDKELMAGLPFLGLSGQSVATMTFRHPRYMYARALSTYRYLLLGVIAAGVVMGLFSLLLSDRLIFRRLSVLSRQVSEVTRAGDLGAAVAASGNDEVGRLGGEINAMLVALKAAGEKLSRAEILHQAVTRTAGCGIFIIQSSRYVYMNPAGARICGYDQEELYQMDFWETVHPDHRSLVRARAMARLEGREAPDHYEIKILHKTQGERWLDLTITTIEHQGAPAILSTCLDITERKQAETELKQSEARFRSLFETMAAGVVYQDRDGAITMVNPAACEILGLSRDELMGRNSLDPRWRGVREDGGEYPGREHPSMVALATGREVRGEIIGVYNPRIEKWRWLRVDAVPEFRPGETSPCQVYITFTDMTDHRLALTALAESEEKFRKFADEASFDGIIVHEQGRIIDVSQPFCRMHGYAREELLGMDAYHTVAPKWRDFMEERIRKGLEEPYEVEALRKDGSTFPIEIRPRNLVLKGKAVRTAAVRDLSDRKRAERRVREANARYRNLFERAGDAIFLLEAEGDNPGTIVDANQAAADMHGYGRRELVGKHIIDLDDPEASRLVKERVARMLAGEWLQAEAWHRRKDGSLFPVEISAGEVTLDGKRYILAFDRDVSDRHRARQKRQTLEEQLRQAQKMEAVGTLAGGIAHDFNNVLQAVGGYLQLLGIKGDDPGRRADYLARIDGVLERAASTVRQLLAFSRRLEPSLRPMSLNEHVRVVMPILEASLPKMIEVQSKLADDLPLVNADAGQIEQVLLNLAANAAHAMPEGGVLTLATSQRTVAAGASAREAGAGPGDYARLTVADTGVGMDGETRRKIFEPFFTTKAEGVGTGLGLAMVYGIVKAHGGFIEVESRLGAGSAFQLYFPALPRGAALVPGRQATTAPGPGRGETVLLVDDEKAIRETGEEILTSGGYRALTAESGEEAIELMASAGPLDLVVLDLSMPGMGGEKALVELLRLDPDLKVIICSGYRDQARVAALLQKGAAAFLDKPFRFEKLLATLREVLDS